MANDTKVTSTDNTATDVYTMLAAYKYLKDNGERIHDIGKVFFMDHSSVIHSIKAFNNALSVNDTIALEKWQRIQKL